MPIRTAIFGCGKTSALHMPTLAGLAAYEITGVYDVSEDAAKKVAGEYGCRSFATYEEALASDAYELAIVLTPSYTHMQVTCDLLANHKKVVVTKPWVLNCREADKVFETLKKTGGTVIPWLPRHWSQNVRSFKSLINSGRIGKVFHIIHSEVTFGKRSDWQVWKKYGGGYLNNWGPHVIGAALDVAGDRVAEVFADTKQIINPGDTEDMFHAMMKTRNGTLISAEYTIATDDLPNWIIRGDQGTIYATGDRIEVREVRYTGEQGSDGYRSDYTVEKCEITSGAAYDTCEIYSHIADVIHGTTDYEISMADLYHLTQVMDAVSESSRTGKAVEIQEALDENG